MVKMEGRVAGGRCLKIDTLFENRQSGGGRRGLPGASGREGLQGPARTEGLRGGFLACPAPATGRPSLRRDLEGAGAEHPVESLPPGRSTSETRVPPPWITRSWEKTGGGRRPSFPVRGEKERG